MENNRRKNKSISRANEPSSIPAWQGWPECQYDRYTEAMIRLLDIFADDRGYVSISRKDLAMLLKVSVRILDYTFSNVREDGDLRHLNAKECREAGFPVDLAGFNNDKDIAVQLTYRLYAPRLPPDWSRGEVELGGLDED